MTQSSWDKHRKNCKLKVKQNSVSTGIITVQILALTVNSSQTTESRFKLLSTNNNNY